MYLLLRQIRALIVKNLLLVVVRPCVTTPLRALILPIVYIAFVGYARFLFTQPSVYGIGEPKPLHPFVDASNGRDKLVFVNNGFVGGYVEQVISIVAEPAKLRGDNVRILASESDLRDICRSNLRGVSSCLAAAVFHSSPNEGLGGIWNYTIRADAELGSRLDVHGSNTDEAKYLFPFQHSIDWAIAQVNGTIDASTLPSEITEYVFTSLTQEQRDDRLREGYMDTITNILGVAIFLGLIGVTYQLTGLIAMERELGMSQLIDCMMPNVSRWQPQAARFIAAHLALDLVYGPGWVITGAILKAGAFNKTSAGIIIINNLLTGLALSSFSIFGASFFKKAELSGISAVIACLLLGIVAQLVPVTANSDVIILSLLFPPMNHVYFTIFMARWERHDRPTNLVNSAPESPWTVPGIVLWLFLVVQIFVYPILGALVERALYGTASRGLTAARTDAPSAVTLDSVSKLYQPSWFYRKTTMLFGRNCQRVLAVNSLSLDIVKGQIMILLGANGSGKSTTLDAISGLTKLTSGEIRLNYGRNGGTFGLCPQKNVLWDSLTVKEHVIIFNRLKSMGNPDADNQISKLIKDCDLGSKVSACSKTLSGGQKRKLQLAMMFTGGSSICCVDEVSSGVDPISRRKIWDILLAERGARTILLTTHFLDEAELLADHIAILSRGVLKVEGSSAGLKHQLGSGYRIYVQRNPGSGDYSIPMFKHIPREVHFDETVYKVKNSADTTRFVTVLEQEGITDYRVCGPSIEDVFLKVAEELELDNQEPGGSDGGNTIVMDERLPKFDGEKSFPVDDVTSQAPRLMRGRRVGVVHQTLVLFGKRATILRRNALLCLAAFLIPVIAAGLVTLFLPGVSRTGCSADQTSTYNAAESLERHEKLHFVLGPSSKVQSATLNRVVSVIQSDFPSSLNSSYSSNGTTDNRSLHMVDSFEEFRSYIDHNFANVTPGGVYFGDSSSPPTFAWNGDRGSLVLPAITQNVLDMFLTNVSIGFQYQPFDIPRMPDASKILQLITYLNLAMAVYPAFFALYPTVERLRNVRALHYSSGVRSLALWMAYLGFDFCIVAITSAFAVIIFRAVSSIWYHPEYLFVVFFLYGLCSTLLSYIVSHFARSQLAAFALAAGGQCVMYLVYLIVYVAALVYSPVDKIDRYVNVAYFTVAIVSPVASLARSMFVSLNFFSILCRGTETAMYPGEITVYGGPILYLTFQSLLFLGVLVWLDAGLSFSWLRSRNKENRITEDEEFAGAGVSSRLSRMIDMTNTSDGLRVMNLTKTFGKSVAIEDVSFSVCKGEVFALLGPNGAGKTTTLSLIRGDMPPSRHGGEIFVENISVRKHRGTARLHLGVCPQFDAIDQMTVLEHLRFYARIRGVPDVEHNVHEILRAVGLTAFKERMAMKLSGGNKRKLSLGIALMGNPTVLLLDEPSSGMDAAAKRVMWKTLGSIVPGRSIVLTTHSMEEADALAGRAGILAGRMLALGTTEYLRQKYGNMYHVHLVHAQAPHTSDEDMHRLRNWVWSTFPGAMIQQKTYHGQLRFSVPATLSVEETATTTTTTEDTASSWTFVDETQSSMARDGSSFCSTTMRLKNSSNTSSASMLFSCLEQNKSVLGVQYYSISQTSLDQVFLSIVGQHDVAEENSE